MKLENKTANDFANVCANKIITELGIDKLVTLPYEAITSEIVDIVEDIEDRIDKIIVNKIADNIPVSNIDNLWE